MSASSQTRRLLRMMEESCPRPAAYVGSTSFEKLAIFLDGYEAGLQADEEEWSGAMCSSVLHDDFRRFLVEKYKCPCNLVWWALFRKVFVNSTDSDPSMFTLLLSDFREFANPLLRLAVELR